MTSCAPQTVPAASRNPQAATDEQRGGNQPQQERRLDLLLDLGRGFLDVNEED